MSRDVRNHLVILCDRCGVEVAIVNADTVGYPNAEIAQAEVWFSPPGNRGGIRYTDANGDLNDKRVMIYDSCNECAATAMSLVEAYYKNRDRFEANEVAY